MTTRLQALALVLSLSACAADLGDDAATTTGATEQEIDSFNGKSLNGTSLAGTSLAIGDSLASVALAGTSRAGSPIAAVTAGDEPLTGAAMVGSHWRGTSAAGVAVSLRIDSATRGTGTNADLWFYAVSYQTVLGWLPLCGVDLFTGPVLAVATPGTWTATAADAAAYGSATSAFTFACRGKTIGKCVELGYKAWDGYSPELQACVRALRADYCGTGVSYTVDGTLLDIYDDAQVQLDTEAWHPEAEWTELGAACINSTAAWRYELTAAKDPKCAKKLKTATCGTSFSAGTRVIDELPTP